MKMRFSARCARCGNPLHMGDRALRVYGGYWHNACIIAYRKQREALRVRRDA